MSIIKWIQISDLHFGSDSHHSKECRDSLAKFIKEKQWTDIDCIFVTGDIIYARNINTDERRKEAYADAEKYLRDMHKCVWPTDAARDIGKRIYIVPGNHDVVRNSARKSTIDGIIADYKNKGKIDDSFCDNIRDSMKFFYEFEKSLKGDYSSIDTDCFHYLVETEKINVLHVNTCIASGKDDEEGKLILSDEWLIKSFNNKKNAKPTVAIAHHGVDLLDYNEQKMAELTLKKNGVFLYLCGHTHARESNLILRYNQKQMLNSFTAGTLIADENESSIETVFLKGEMDTELLEGKIHSFKWNYEGDWHEDNEFGLAQKTYDNSRTFRGGELYEPFYTHINDNAKKIKKDDGVLSKIVSHVSASRTRAFTDINEKATSTLSVYGIGITHVSKNRDLMDRIMEKGGKVRLCMVDPRIFKEGMCDLKINHKERSGVATISIDGCNLNDLNFCIYASHMDSYIREEYVEDIDKSFQRIKKYKKQIEGKNWDFQVRMLKSFIPISINIVNEDSDNSELIAEYNMPFVEKRLLLNLSRKQNANYYGEVMKVYEKIWELSDEVR